MSECACVCMFVCVMSNIPDSKSQLYDNVITNSTETIAHSMITDHYHPRSNLGVCLSEGCFIFDFVSLPLDVARPI